MPTTSKFIVVDDHAISLADYVDYLAQAGMLESSLSAVLRQYFIDNELKKRADEIEIASETVQQSIIEFRMTNQLTETEAFNQWLQSQNMSYEVFHRNIEREFSVQKLKQIVATDKIQDYFIENKLYLDQVVLSRIAVAQREMAEEIKAQLDEGQSFELLARQYSVAPEKATNGMMGLLRRGELPDQLRGLVDNAKPGEILGPLEIDQKWTVFRLDSLLPASLEDPEQELTVAIENEVFEKWITESIQSMDIQLNLD